MGRLPALAAGADKGVVDGAPPLHLQWSVPGRPVDLADRRQRARLYEVVLREGAPQDFLRYVDGLLLADAWDELVVPVAVRAAWAWIPEVHVVATPVQLLD